MNISKIHLILFILFTDVSFCLSPISVSDSLMGISESSQTILALPKYLRPISYNDYKELNTLLDDLPKLVPEGDTLDDKLVSLLLGTRKYRQGKFPSSDQVEFLRDLVSSYTKKNKPINISILWGATKGFGVFNNSLEADVFDFMAFRRFLAIQKNIRTIYEPGIKVTVVVEDITGILISGLDKEKVMPKIKRYYDTLNEMARIFGFNQFIEIELESNYVESKGLIISKYITVAKENSQVIFDYLKALIRVDFKDDELIEFDELRALGWKGVLSKHQWYYYFERARTAHPFWNIEEIMKCVCFYLGNSLARYQKKILENNPDEIPIKASFVPYPPGTDRSLYFGRIEYKVKDGKSYTATIPPWSGFGFKNLITNKIEFFGVRQMRLFRGDNLSGAYAQFKMEFETTQESS